MDILLCVLETTQCLTSKRRTWKTAEVDAASNLGTCHQRDELVALVVTSNRTQVFHCHCAARPRVRGIDETGPSCLFDLVSFVRRATISDIPVVTVAIVLIIIKLLSTPPLGVSNSLSGRSAVHAPSRQASHQECFQVRRRCAQA